MSRDIDRAQEIQLMEIEANNRPAPLLVIDPADLEPRDCSACGDDIPPARIRAVPHARKCAGCATQDEKKSRLYAR